MSRSSLRDHAGPGRGEQVGRRRREALPDLLGLPLDLLRARGLEEKEFSRADALDRAREKQREELFEKLREIRDELTLKEEFRGDADSGKN